MWKNFIVNNLIQGSEEVLLHLVKKRSCFQVEMCASEDYMTTKQNSVVVFFWVIFGTSTNDQLTCAVQDLCSGVNNPLVLEPCVISAQVIQLYSSKDSCFMFNMGHLKTLILLVIKNKPAFKQHSHFTKHFDSGAAVKLF